MDTRPCDVVSFHYPLVTTRRRTAILLWGPKMLAQIRYGLDVVVVPERRKHGWKFGSRGDAGSRSD